MQPLTTELPLLLACLVLYLQTKLKKGMKKGMFKKGMKSQEKAQRARGAVGAAEHPSVRRHRPLAARDAGAAPLRCSCTGTSAGPSVKPAPLRKAGLGHKISELVEMGLWWKNTSKSAARSEPSLEAKNAFVTVCDCPEGALGTALLAGVAGLSRTARRASHCPS